MEFTTNANAVLVKCNKVKAGNTRPLRCRKQTEVQYSFTTDVQRSELNGTMAARISAVFIVSLYISSVSPRRDPSSIKGIFRNRRDVCVDGTYTVINRTCCLCPAGQRVETVCNKNPNDGKCMICESDTYSSDPNSEDTCVHCTSCEQTNANLEEDEPCTPVRNRKCRCKNGYFCSSKECTICQPCSICGFGGIKADCTPTSDTVCNGPAGAIVAIVVLVVILVIGAIVAAGYVVIRRKTRDRNNQMEQEGKDESGPHVAIPLLQDHVDIERLLPDIANELGWMDMKNIAIRMGVGNGIIEYCEINNPNNAEEQTLQLLMRTVEKEGKEAPKKLIQTLEKMNKRGKAEKISDILSEANST